MIVIKSWVKLFEMLDNMKIGDIVDFENDSGSYKLEKLNDTKGENHDE